MLVSVIYGKGHGYQVIMSLISSHTRKPTVDIFSQREFSKKGKCKLSFDSYPLISKPTECGVADKEYLDFYHNNMKQKQ